MISQLGKLFEVTLDLWVERETVAGDARGFYGVCGGPGRLRVLFAVLRAYCP